MRVGWRERGERPGWDVWYTTIGGRFDFDPIAQLQPSVRVPAQRAITQAMCAATPRSGEPSDEVSFWASVVRKVVQRGTRPTIFHRDRANFDTPGARDDELLAAIVGPLSDRWDLDPSFDLHPTFERPFWDMLGHSAAPLRRWLTPQGWFEGLTGAASPTRERWVDFVLYRPWGGIAGVIEIDGSGHNTSTAADAARDRLLERAGIRVRRFAGIDALDPTHPNTAGLRSHIDRPWLGTAEPSLVAAVHGPAAIHRFAYAIAEAVERGFLRPGAPWHIALNDPTGVASARPNMALDLLDAIAAVWDLDIVPHRIILDDRCWERGADGRFASANAPVDGQAQVDIEIDPFTPAHAALPAAMNPAVVMRGCLLPVDLAWSAPTSLERRNRTGNERSLAALDRLVHDLYGYDGFREGQREAISRLLSGGDALVLLPTGAGKTLIYQLSGLLRPGVTLVVAPLKALIDDQERRLRDLGIDRVVGLHSGKRLSTNDRRQIQASIGRGEAIVVLVAPERLQIEEFRQQLGEAASHHLVNLAVVDEAHCVSEWGHQFRTSYLRLGRNLRRLCADRHDGPPPLLALTATASPGVLRDMTLELGLDENDPGMTHRPRDFERPNLHYRVFAAQSPLEREPATARALEWIARELGTPPSELALARGPDTASGIIFVPHARSGLALGIDTFSSVARNVLGAADDAIAQYSGRPPNDAIPASAWEQRKADFADEFRRNARPVMVSTNAFGMGIDKPNIRYTLHVMLPSSIEAFAQESGRAGRDQRDSYCALVAPVAIDEGIKSIERNAPPAKFAKNDIDVQLGFLRQGFVSPVVETASAAAVATELLSVAGPGAQVTIPRGDGDADAERREKALFRLLLVGLVDDYTIEYGSNTFTVYLTRFNAGSLRAATADFVARATGTNPVLVDRIDAVGGETIGELVTGLVGELITTVYNRVEPARRRALHEMLQLSGLGDDGHAIRSRINAYLTEGPVASLLDKAVRGEAGLVATMDALLDVPPNDLEWTGAAARYLESYPDHPLLLAVRALGEAWRPDGSRDEFRRLMAAFADALETFGLDDDGAGNLVARVLDLLRSYFGGTRWEWTADVWDVLERSHIEIPELRSVEDRVLDLAADGRFHIIEVNRVIRRRIYRAAGVGDKIVQHHVRDEILR